MRENFNSVSVDFNLPPYLTEALWKSRIISNPAVATIVHRMSHSGLITTEREAHVLVDDVISTVRAAELHGREFFAYRGGVLPDSVYYDLLARPAIQLVPDIAGALPEEYKTIATQRDRLETESGFIHDGNLHPVARFCYWLDRDMRLQKFYKGLQDGSVKLGGEQNMDLYNRLVQPVKENCRSESDLSRDLQDLTRRIDFIWNHGDNPMFWFVPMGAEWGEKICDKDHVASTIGFPKQADQAFRLSYASFEDRLGTGHDAFYHLAKSVINPMTYMLNQREAFHVPALKYVFAHAALVQETANDYHDQFDVNTRLIHEAYKNGLHDAETLKPLGLDERDLRLISNAFLINDLVLQTATYWGDRVRPFMRTDDMESILELLQKTEKLEVQTPDLKACVETWRRYASARYNATANEFESLGFEYYNDPLFYPANDPSPPKLH